MGRPDGSRRELDHAGVRATEEAYDRAWCAGDLDALMDCLARDAVLVSPRGEVAIGEDAIRRALGEVLRREAPGSTHRSTIDRVSFVGDDVVVVDGRAEIGDGPRPADGAMPLQHEFTDILVRVGERWVIAHVRAYAIRGAT